MKSENSQNSRPPVPEKSTSRRRSISCKRLVNRRCSTPLRELSPACVNSKALVPYVPRKVLIRCKLFLERTLGLGLFIVYERGFESDENCNVGVGKKSIRKRRENSEGNPNLGVKQFIKSFLLEVGA